MAHNTNFDPVQSAPFLISPLDTVATAGSCFAQHISRRLTKLNYNYLVTERPPQGEAIYSARYGNVYTARQLRQLFDRAFDRTIFNNSWINGAGRVIDPFRPREYPTGFSTLDEMKTERSKHLDAVKRMFETCNVFVFTLGLTEGWISTIDGSVVPLPPGVASVDAGLEQKAFKSHNFDVDEIVADMRYFLAALREINSSVRVILTVSPVPLAATYEARHILISNTVSKARLRIAVDTICAAERDIFYFPSYEIITSGYGHKVRYKNDLRTVTDDGVNEVMELFTNHFTKTMPSAKPLFSFDDTSDIQSVVCEEETLDPGAGKL